MPKKPTNCTEKKSNVWWQRSDIILPIISLLVTPFLSLIVVDYQLSKEHTFVQNQQKIVREKIKIDNKVKLHSKTIKFLGITGSTRYSGAVSQFYATLELKYLLDGLEKYRAPYNESIKNIEDTIKTIGNNYAELLATLEESQLYFGKETNKAIDRFLDFAPPNLLISTPDIKKITESFKLAERKGTSQQSIILELEKQLHNSIAGDKYINLGRQVTRAMKDEIAKDLLLK